MKMNFWGDSYDIVKKFLIHSIEPNADWIVFPMFSHDVNDKDIIDFELFLNVRVISKTIITVNTNRDEYLADSANHKYIFIDPDTGVKIKKFYGAK